MPLRLWGRVNLRERLPVGRPQFIVQLNIEYIDGSRESLASDSSWKVAPGPILRNSIYLGEKVDARKTVESWDRLGLDDSDWKSAPIVPAPEGPLQAQPMPPIKVTATVTPVRGWARFTFDVPAGTEITMRYGELLYEDGTLNPMTSVCGEIKRKKPIEDGSPPPSPGRQTRTSPEAEVRKPTRLASPFTPFATSKSPGFRSALPWTTSRDFA